MVKAIKRNNHTLYICEECSLAYLDKSWAQKCEEYCKTQNACSLAITKHAYSPQDRKIIFEP
ncbi:MAG: DUF7128 family protein [Candidatus Ranarchaeia archaeon]